MQENLSGIIIVNKEKNMTSYDVVKEISKQLGTRKVGHTGTLDPMAEGVLIVCVGEATKIAELITAHDKEYIAEAVLGIKTDTYDIEGKVIETKEVPKNIELKKVLSSFQKTYLQEVPIYSAVKVNGKKLYEYARNKEEVELPKKEVTIKEIELLDWNENKFKFRCQVTKGCYIRSLINDIGIKLGTGATMTSLIRTKQGRISIKESYTLQDIKNNHYKMISIEDVLVSIYPIVKVEGLLEKQIKNGVKIKNQWNIETKVLFKNKENKLLGIYQKENDILKVWKNFKN